MKTNHDGTVTLNAYDTWTSCLACGQRVTGDSIHTCSPQLKTLTDEEIISSAEEAGFNWSEDKGIFVRHSNGSWIGLDSKMVDFARAILRKAQDK